MCLAVPLRIASLLPGDLAIGEHGQVRLEFSVALLDHPQVGDFALVHAGVAIETIDPESALDTLRLLKEVVDGPTLE
ncbi:MAG: HypC/HybG/HupF family hydrogenase formation chaperone [Fibrobacteria bacterium]|nr:HypC/HybG/HupF family hydrogenase formation chaperone [Fibrobacteria bacterium]